MAIKATGLIFIATALSACGISQSSISTPEFSSAHSIALDGVIDNGTIYTSTTNPFLVKNEIREQLRFSVGHLNGNNGVADLNRLEISVQETEKNARGDLNRVSFAAKLFVAWPVEVAIPTIYTMTLPSQGDYNFLAQFFDHYGVAECMDTATHDAQMGNHWYYYRPMRPGCQYKISGDVAANDTFVKFDVAFSKSAENTPGTFPEYTKIWEDGKGVVTAIFGMADSYTASDFDAGVSAYRNTYHDLINQFGTPVFDSLKEQGLFPGMDHPESSLTFTTPSGPLEIHLFLVKSIREVDQAFVARYEELTQISDFVSYSGHSGLGANIRALTRMGRFLPNQYQVFLINGCDTFAYVDNSLRDAHAILNPGASVNKYFDIITNAMPSYFHMNSRSNLAVIKALVGKTKTYEQILKEFDIEQRAVVTGDEDNQFPKPF